MKSAILLLMSLAVNTLFCQANFSESNTGVFDGLTGDSYYREPETGNLCFFICGLNGVVKKTTDGGNTWINIRNNLPSTNYHVIHAFNCNDIGLWYTYNGMPYYTYSTNGGANWVTPYEIQWSTFVHAQEDYPPILIDNAITDTAFAYGNPKNGRWGLAVTTDRGVTYDTTGLYLPQQGAETGWINCMDIHARYVWFGANNPAGVYRGYRFHNWQRLTTPGLNAVYCLWFNDTLKGMVGGDNGILYTTNKGDSWTQLSIGGSGNVKGIVSDGGQNWWAARGGSIWFSSNYGTSWNMLYTAPSGNYNHITIDSSKRYIAGIRDNGGVTLGTITVGIRQISNEIPSHFSLSQNYPNPFNPSTKIKFDVPVEGRYGNVPLQLKIYDMLGREVAALVNEQLKPGGYEVTWDASAYPSGIYYYRIEAGDYSETKKMALIK